jgi:branched-chain amino acid transport system substrate-binding protein
MTTLSRVMGGVLLAVAVAASPGSAGAADPVKIGLLASLTTDLALIGGLQRNAGVMAVEEFNAASGGPKIELVIEDGAASPTVALAGFRKILAEKPVAFLAPLWSTQLLAMFPEIKKEGVPTFSTSGTRNLTQQGNQRYFRFFPHDGMTKTAYTEFAINELQRRKIGIIHVSNEYGMSGRDVILATLTKSGLTPVAVESFNPGDKDVSAPLLNIRKAGADVLISQALIPETALIIKQRRQLGIDIPHVSSSAASAPTMAKLVSEADMDGTYAETAAVPGIDPRPEVQRWVKAYAEKFKATPDVFAHLYYDMTRMLLQAIKDVGPDREKIRQRLEQQPYQGLAMTYRCDEEHNCNHRVIIIKYDGFTPKIVRSYDSTPK